MKRGTASANFSDSCAKKEKEDEARALLEEMQKIVCNGRESIQQAPRLHANLDRGRWTSTVCHGQNLADVAKK